MPFPRATALAAVTGLMLTGGAAPASASPSHAPASDLDWRLCADIARGWDEEDDLTQCSTVTVPLDHGDPDGRTIDIALSRVPAAEESAFPVLFNPGGPGQQGVTMPGRILDSQASGLGLRHDLIGLDPRGVGHSGAVDCDYDIAGPEPGLGAEERARFEAEQVARAARDCYDRDPALAESLTAENAARDLDLVREALGVETIGYYGVSWGTLLGATYRSMYDDRVEAMLLDSVMNPDSSLTVLEEGQIAEGDAVFHRFTDWVAEHDSAYGLGEDSEQLRDSVLDLQRELAERPRSGPDGTVVDHESVTMLLATPESEWPDNARSLVTLLEGGVPEQGVSGTGHSGAGWDAETDGATPFAQVAYFCNDSDSPRDFDQVWEHRLDRAERFPAMGTLGFYEHLCVGWPREGAPPALSAGNSPLQLVGHTHEMVTPYVWAHEMRQVVGGEVMSVEDDGHGTLSDLDCAVAAIDFFATGDTTTETCPGPPPPSPATDGHPG